MKDISMRNAEQLGRAIRLQRLEKGLSQQELASLADVERKWVIRLEAGNPAAELGRVFKALDALGMQMSLAGEGEQAPDDKHRHLPSRLDEVFRQLQRPQRK